MKFILVEVGKKFKDDSNNLLLNDEPFCFGEQVSRDGNVYPPLIFFATSINGDLFKVLDTSTGKVHRYKGEFSRLNEEHQIPINTKISEDGKLKLILPKSHILYRHSDGIYYPCVVKILTNNFPTEINCANLGVFTPKWDEIFPIEALPKLPESLGIYGFTDAKTVTLDALSGIIDALPKRALKK